MHAGNADMNLKGKIVFITGAAQGLGKQHITTLLEKGSKIYFCDVDEAKGTETAARLSERFGPENIQFAHCDVTDHARFEEVFKQAISYFGHIDIMINNAGIFDTSQWQLENSVNYVATVVGTKMATEHMRKDKGGKGGRIVNVSSEAGLLDTFSTATYGATKHAVRSYTTSVSRQPDLEKKGIEYALLCPASAETDMILGLDDSKTEYLASAQAYLNKYGLVKPERVTLALLDLLQREEMNGVILYVNKDVITQKAVQIIDVDEFI